MGTITSPSENPGYATAATYLSLFHLPACNLVLQKNCTTGFWIAFLLLILWIVPPIFCIFCDAVFALCAPDKMYDCLFCWCLFTFIYDLYMIYLFMIYLFIYDLFAYDLFIYDLFVYDLFIYDLFLIRLYSSSCFIHMSIKQNIFKQLLLIKFLDENCLTAAVKWICIFQLCSVLSMQQQKLIALIQCETPLCHRFPKSL